MTAGLVIEVEATGERRRHPAGRLRLGRAADNDWVLPDPDPQPSLSRRHCVIEATESGFAVTDLGSTNGTRLNGAAVAPHTPTPLAAGDRLQLGRHVLRLAFEEASPASPLDALLGGLVVADPEPGLAAAPPRLSPGDDPLGGPFDEVPHPVARPVPPRREAGATPGDHAQPQLEALVVSAAAPAPPPSPPSPSLADGAAGLHAFLEGAGLEPDELAGEPATLLRDAGRAFAAMAAGLRDLLTARALVKDHAGVARTVIGAADNNPLKYAGGRAEAVRALLAGREDGYLPPLAAIEAGLTDLKAHELALLEGVQAAVLALLAQFDPARLETRLADASSLGLLLQGGRRARLWELYTERYGAIAEAARVRFMGDVDRAFAAAYERKVREMGGSVP
jgi:type VI secretion system FHA domain protein